MRIRVNGEALTLDDSGALWWPDRETLVLADIHFEKGSFYAARGTFLPPYDSRAMLGRIEKLQAHFRPARVIALGDSFHDMSAEERFGVEERDRLSSATSAQDWIWISGNHDPEPPSWLSGRRMDEFADGGLVFRHEPSMRAPAGEIAGHLHPCHTVTRRGRSLRRRCFVSDGMRMVMPAFGAYAGGLDLYDEVYERLFPCAFLAYMLGMNRVYAVAA
jgi:DNA ligase-associated metallophosphoesterase